MWDSQKPASAWKGSSVVPEKEVRVCVWFFIVLFCLGKACTQSKGRYYKKQTHPSPYDEFAGPEGAMFLDTEAEGRGRGSSGGLWGPASSLPHRGLGWQVPSEHARRHRHAWLAPRLRNPSFPGPHLPVALLRLLDAPSPPVFKGRLRGSALSSPSHANLIWSHSSLFHP